ncbi:MAG TPA: hypothetical protein VK674_01960 [Candidatus Limnocylindria bacterium]|nr:hypothetical protein [Candidatus Limnocylindria bacterium]
MSKNISGRRFLRLFLRPKVLAGFGALVIVAGLVMGFYRFNQAPVTGVVRPPDPAPRVAAATFAHFNGAAIAFDYSTDYRTVENRAGPVLPITEQYSLAQHSPTEGSRRISITVKNFSGGPMLEDSAYAFRRNEAGKYKADEVTMGEDSTKKTARTMTSKDGSEVTYFIPGKSAYAIVSATSTRPNEDFLKEAAALVRSFVWR